MGSSQRLVVSGVGPDEQALNKLTNAIAQLVVIAEAMVAARRRGRTLERLMAMTP